MIKIIRDLKTLWIVDIIKRKKETPFIIFLFFLLAFALSRLVVVFFPGFNVLGLGFVKTYHIHHYYWGIVLLLAAGWISFVTDSIRLKRVAAGIYGFGFGLLIDEIGLLLTCGTQGLGCDYWTRVTYDIVTYIVVLFLIIIYFEPFWKVFHTKILRNIHNTFKVFYFKKGK